MTMTISSTSDKGSQVQIQKSIPVAPKADISIASPSTILEQPAPEPGSLQDQIGQLDLEKLWSNMTRFEGEFATT